MSGYTAKLERKEARRVLGDRTSSIVGELRGRLTTLEAEVVSLTKRSHLQEDLIEVLVTEVKALTKALDRFQHRVDHDREDDRAARQDVSDRLDTHRHAGFVARLQWLLMGR